MDVWTARGVAGLLVLSLGAGGCTVGSGAGPLDGFVLRDADASSDAVGDAAPDGAPDPGGELPPDGGPTPDALDADGLDADGLLDADALLDSGGDGEVAADASDAELPPDVGPPELCNGIDDDGDGLVDTGCGPPYSASAGAVVHDLGLVDVGNGKVSAARVFGLGEGASAFDIVLLDADGSNENLAVWQLFDPVGALVAAVSEPFGHEVRDLPGFATAVVQVPDRGGYLPPPGLWTFTLFRNGGSSHVWARVVENRRPAPTASEIDLNLWFVGLDEGLDASTAPTDPDFQAVLSNLAGRLAAFGITVGATEYFDVTGVDAQKYSYLDLATAPLVPGEDSELVKLSHSLPQTNRGLDFFFVMGVSVQGVVAKAGSIPGPPLHHGVVGSGVIVSMANYFAGSKQAAAPLLGVTMAHELGHQLGLYHTSESNGQQHDPIADTPECTEDTNQNGKVEPWECQGSGAGNLMFWAATTGGTLTAEQLDVIHRNPALHAPQEAP
ncbi:MAG: hypothetical protein H6744_01925 [Deltaproteobacteria bacterium]|nr:hypothetical protein [Deltaproteobacteria bacterium]